MMSDSSKYDGLKQEFLAIPHKVMVYQHSIVYRYSYYWTAILELDSTWIHSLSQMANEPILNWDKPYKVVLFRETSETLDVLLQSYYMCFESEQDAFEYALRMK